MTYKQYSKGKGNNDSFSFCNPNPANRDTNDCTTRAISIALDISWDGAFDMQCAYAKNMKVIQNNDCVTDKILRANGFRHVPIHAANKGCKRLRVIDIVKNNKASIVVIRCANHITAAIDGVIHDTWNTSNRTAYGYWVLDK